jgi:hypothetical protein
MATESRTQPEPRHYVKPHTEKHEPAKFVGDSDDDDKGGKECSLYSECKLYYYH